MNKITSRVSKFYNELPFNYYKNYKNQATSIIKRNSILSYPNLHNLLKGNSNIKKILDVGCGPGLFANNLCYYYKLDVVGIDLSSTAINRAKKTCNDLNIKDDIHFICEDLFNIPKNFGKFSLVNSMGVLHHTYSCKKALETISSFVDNQGYVHIGLYHKYGRKPFLDLFTKYRTKIKNNQKLNNKEKKEAFKIYRELNSNTVDEDFLYSWFRDQVLHPHETKHTLKEVYNWLTEMRFELLSTSINQFEKIKNINELFELEKAYYDISFERNVKEKKYFPGFFTVLAKKL
ncbi:MAG: class I SAM-dependent methyltransferase [Candidatus Lokiarchaeota archaeon]|nr:class I SAM-dependent methyltransferase [Candidatus Lokiarchaeota archaeon]